MRKEIKLELEEDGKTVLVKQDYVPARKVREALKIQVQIEETGVNVEVLDSMVEFAASLFKEKDNVTADRIWDGLASWDLMPSLQSILGEVMGTGNDENLVESH